MSANNGPLEALPRKNNPSGRLFSDGSFLTYADIDPKKIERFVSSPMFPAWCERMESKAKDALAAMEREANAAIEGIKRRRNAN